MIDHPIVDDPFTVCCEQRLDGVPLRRHHTIVMPRKSTTDALAVFDTLVYTCQYRLVIDPASRAAACAMEWRRALRERIGTFNEAYQMSGITLFGTELLPEYEGTLADAIGRGSAGFPPFGLNLSGQLDPMTGAPEVYTAQFTIAEGEHELYCPTECLGSAYGFGDYNSYALHLGYGTGSMPTAIDDPASSTTSSTIVFIAGEELHARMFGIGGWSRLAMLDATGREALSAGPGSSLVISLPDGRYQARATGRDGNTVVQYLLVLRP